MRITFLADMRSPIARQWIEAVLDRGHEIQIISSHPVDRAALGGAPVTTVPLVFARAAAVSSAPTSGTARATLGHLRQLVPPQHAGLVRSIVGPLAARRHRHALQSLVDKHRPDLVHAMRIPFEGIAATHLNGPPLVVSVWGNDFTLFGGRTPALAHATRLTLQRASALHCDCHRDARLAREWGFSNDRPVWVLPGNGGVDLSIFGPGESNLRAKLGLPAQARVIVNPRGIREYVRTDVFFASLVPVFAQMPDVHVVCPGMAYSGLAHKLVRSLRLKDRVHLLPACDPAGMADIFRAAEISVSLSQHDGTPNTLLEAMACGSFPIVGDVESVKEWIRDGQNGFVVSAEDPAQVAAALTRTLTDSQLLDTSNSINAALVTERADLRSCMDRVMDHYQSVATAHRS